MKIKTNNVPADCDYLTNGKEYELIRAGSTSSYDCGFIMTDCGTKIATVINNSAHLNGASWEIVE